MKTALFFFINIALLGAGNAQEKVTLSDFKILDGTSWNGNLMYINYSDGKEVTLKTSLQIKLDNDKIILKIKFPDEPGADSKSIIEINDDGTYFGKEKIIKRRVEANGHTTIVTTFVGTDNNKSATIYKTYQFSEEEFVITKKVKLENSDDEFIRNRYSFTKNK